MIIDVFADEVKTIKLYKKFGFVESVLLFPVGGHRAHAAEQDSDGAGQASSGTS
jgi:hypothetical protein